MTSSERSAENRRKRIHAEKAYDRGLVRKYNTAKREFRDIAKSIRSASLKDKKDK